MYIEPSCELKRISSDTKVDKIASTKLTADAHFFADRQQNIPWRHQQPSKANIPPPHL